MVYVLLADGFEEVEAITPIDYLRRCEGVKVTTVGIGKKTVTGSHGITITCDCEDKKADFSEMQMVVLPGGMPGTLNLEKSKVVQQVLDAAWEKGAYIGAICAAPSILGHKGFLNGKRAVCFPGFEKELAGAEVLAKPVCVDGKIITAKGAGAANQFAFALAKQLCGEDRAYKLAASVQWEG